MQEEQRSREELLSDLRLSEATLRGLVVAAPIGIGHVQERILGWTNEQITRMTGYSPDELRGQNARILYPDDAEFERVAIVKHPQIEQEGVGYVETRWQRKDGRVIHVWLSSSAIDPDDLSRGLIFTAMDLTDRRRTECALLESERGYRSLIRNAVYGIYRSSMEGRFLDVNPALVEMLGYESAQKLREKDLATDIYVDAEDRQQLIAVFRKQETIDGVEVQWKRRDGTPITVRLSGRPVRDPDGEPRHWEMIAEDVTERRILQDQLRQSQKLEGIGRLAGGIAHDFNNLLTAIGGYTSLILESIEESSPNHDRLIEIQGAADRATSLTRQLLAFSRKQILNPRILRLNSVVQGMEGLLERLIGENIRLETDLAEDVACIHADQGQIEQVILHLAVNARDAMPDGGTLLISTADVEDLGHCNLCDPDAVPGPRVKLIVRDTGCGMNAELLSRIFEPFFTTKDRERGTGLGLSTVYGIVKQSDGHIRAESEPGKGSTFEVCLPHVEAGVEDRETETPRASTSDGSGLVLIIEDDDGVRSLAEEVLEQSGYTVVSAESGSAALALLAGLDEEIDLLLTDVILPGLSGPNIAARLRETRPELPVVYMSGYTGEAIGKRLAADPGTPLLTKPFTPSALEEIVRETIGR